MNADPTIQENVIAGLLKLPKHANGKKVIINRGGHNSIVDVLKNGSKQESKQLAAETIFYLSFVQENQKLIEEIPEAVPALIQQIRTGTSCGKMNSLAALFGILCKMNSLAALFGILLYPRNHQIALSSGTVPLLSNLVRASENPEIITGSLAVLATLAESFDGSNSIMKASSLPLVIKTLRTSASRAAKGYCVSILLALCNNLGVEVIAVLANNANLIGFLYTVSTNGGSQAGKKARSLIQIKNLIV